MMNFTSRIWPTEWGNSACQESSMLDKPPLQVGSGLQAYVCWLCFTTLQDTVYLDMKIIKGFLFFMSLCLNSLHSNYLISELYAWAHVLYLAFLRWHTSKTGHSCQCVGWPGALSLKNSFQSYSDVCSFCSRKRTHRPAIFLPFQHVLLILLNTESTRRICFPPLDEEFVCLLIFVPCLTISRMGFSSHPLLYLMEFPVPLKDFLWYVIL